MAAAVSYCVLFSLFPLMILAVGVTGLLLQDSAFQDDLIDPLFEEYNIRNCVVDSRPETRSARAFHDRNRSRVHLRDYIQDGVSPRWSSQDRVQRVLAPRTLALDTMLDLFKSRTYAIPSDYRELEDGDYVDHLLAPVRVQEMDSFGHPVARYRKVR